MTNHDVTVATPSDDTSGERPNRSLAEQLVEQARADGKNLVGPGGLLSDLTKQVLETGLEVEMEEHLGYPRRAPHRQRQDLGDTDAATGGFDLSGRRRGRPGEMGCRRRSLALSSATAPGTARTDRPGCRRVAPEAARSGHRGARR